MPRNRRIDQTADEADRLPLFAAEIRGEKAPDLQEQAAENAREVVAAEEADLPVKAETLTALKEAREGDIIEYQGRGWSVIPLGMEVVMTAIGDDGKTLGGPDNFVAFKSYEEFEHATGYKPIAPRPAQKGYVQRINVNLDFIGRVTNGRADLFTPSVVNRVIAKLDALQDKFLNTPSEKEFADLRQHFELINGTMNRLASQLHAIKRGPAAAEETRHQLDALLNATDGESENLPPYSEFRTAQSSFETTIRIAERDAEQIRETQSSGVESAGKEEKSDATETGTRSIRPGEIHRVEGGVSAPFGSRDHRDSAQGGGGGDRDVRADGGGRGRPLGGERADIERPEPTDDTRTTTGYIDEADTSRTETQPPSAARKPDNYEIINPEALVPSGKKSKLDANFAAIGLLKELQAEGRTPNREEQHILAKFVGWGQFPALFNDINDAGEQLTEEREELKRLLGERDYDRAKASTINAHYTAPKIVEKMWDVARRLGYKGGRVLEPGMGVGYFYGLMPRDLMAQSKLAGVEFDPTSGAIARLLYPNASINIKGFQEVKIADGFYDLVITNVPFSENSPFDPEYRNLRAPLHDYYLIKSLDKVREGGLVIAITSSYTLDKGETHCSCPLGSASSLVFIPNSLMSIQPTVCSCIPLHMYISYHG